ncbi:MAG TPA: hypothetical protein DDZ90_33065 [Planctomycetaceae bacterium]|nr:hypothetical protein [Gimesia sp.]HBL48224.1 hypothetical protein [Planctomycetaceae bacterium]
MKLVLQQRKAKNAPEAKDVTAAAAGGMDSAVRSPVSRGMRVADVVSVSVFTNSNRLDTKGGFIS